MATLVAREPVTPDNYSPIISIVNLILLITTVLSVCAKVAMKVFVLRKFNRDDGALIVAMVCRPMLYCTD